MTTEKKTKFETMKKSTYLKSHTADAIREDYIALGGDVTDTKSMTKDDMHVEMVELLKDRMTSTKDDGVTAKDVAEAAKVQAKAATESPAKSEDRPANAGKDTKKKKPVKSDKVDPKKKQAKKAKSIQKKARTAREKSTDTTEVLFGTRDPLDIVLSEGILFKVDSHCWWGKSSRVPEAMLNNAPKKILKGVQALIDDVHIAPLNSYRGKGERVVIKNGFPFLGLRGVYYVPKALIGKTEKGLIDCQNAFFEKLEEFIANFPQYKKEWAAVCKQNKVTIPPEEWYPSMAGLKSKFRFSWLKFAFTLPDKDMGILTEDQYDEELNKQRDKMREFLSSTLTQLALKFEEVISKLNERLEGGETIKPKTLSSLRSFVETFESMNVTGNQDLSKLVGRMEKILGSKDAKTINDSDKIRKNMSRRIGKLVKSVGNLIDSDDKFERSMDF